MVSLMAFEKILCCYVCVKRGQGQRVRARSSSSSRTPASVAVPHHHPQQTPHFLHSLCPTISFVLCPKPFLTVRQEGSDLTGQLNINTLIEESVCKSIKK
jgi:hypothetical protein